MIEISSSVLNDSVRHLKTIQIGISEGELLVRQRTVERCEDGGQDGRGTERV